MKSISKEEQNLIIKVKQFTDIDEKMKIINITEDLLHSLNSIQHSDLMSLKKFKYSIQYCIK